MKPFILLLVAFACSGSGGPRGGHGERTGGISGLRLPAGVRPLAYELRLEVDPDGDELVGEVTIRVRVEAPTDRVWIHAVDLDVKRATFVAASSRGALTPVGEGEQMRAWSFGRRLGPGEVTLAFAYRGHTRGDQEGLFRQHAGGHWYLFSQAESVLARRILPCFDEPRWKTPWRVSIVAPRGQVVLANAPETSRVTLADGRVVHAFAETPAMPSYLLALAVGPFALVEAGTVGRNHVPVRVAALAGDRDRVGVVRARLPAIVTALETYLDDPLPWPKLDLVAVPHLFGAMENPGLITIDAATLVGDPADARFSGHFVTVAAHELVHQWFGNLVTPAWWDDLWLAESFASWLGDRTASALDPHGDPALDLALGRQRALAADDEPAARPLRTPVVHTGDPDSSFFDAIAYAKGPAVLATFEAFVGPARFRAGLLRYLHAHRGGTATLVDLVAVLAAVSTPEVGAAFAGYVERPGPPVVELALRCDRGPATLVAHARAARIVPVCVRYEGDRGPTRACALVGDHTELALTARRGCPAWVHGNDGAAYYHVRWTSGGPRGPAPPIAQLGAGEWIAVGDDLAASVQRGELPVSLALAEVRTLAGVRDPFARLAAFAIARAIDPMVEDAARSTWASWLAARFADELTPSAVELSVLGPAPLALGPVHRLGQTG